MKSGDRLGALRSKEPEIKTWGFAEGCPVPTLWSINFLGWKVLLVAWW